MDQMAVSTLIMRCTIWSLETLDTFTAKGLLRILNRIFRSENNLKKSVLMISPFRLEVELQVFPFHNRLREEMHFSLVSCSRCFVTILYSFQQLLFFPF